jgi:hypothetical protein
MSKTMAAARRGSHLSEGVRGIAVVPPMWQAVDPACGDANNQGSEAFDKQPETFRQMVLDNARTIPLQLLARNPDDLADSVCHCPADGTWRRSVGVRVQ